MMVRYIRVLVYFGTFSEKRPLSYNYTYIIFVKKLIIFFRNRDKTFKIKIIFACLDGIEDSTKITRSAAPTIGNVEPADKLNIRRYIKGVCSTSQCADTFFLYLASPARQDGNALLWDANGNGIVSHVFL